MKIKRLLILLSISFLLNSNKALALGSTQGSIFIDGNKALPIVRFTLLNKSGSSLFDKNPGMLTLLDIILEQSDLSNIVEKRGGSFDISINRDFVAFNLNFLSSESATILTPFFNLLSQFTITQAMLDNAKKQAADALLQEDNDPTTKSYKMFQNALFKGHPYSNPLSGTVDSIRNTTLKDMQTLYKQVVGKSNIDILVVGDSTHISENFAENLLKSLPESSPITGTVPDFKKAQLPVMTKIVEPNLTQSFINVGTTTPSFNLDSFIYFQMMQQIIGGGFNSRLFIELRQKRGIAYSPFAVYRPQLKAGSFDILFPTAKKNTAIALNVTDSIIRNIKEKGFTEFEFSIAKKIVLNAFYKTEETNSFLTSNLINAIINKIPYDYVKYAENKIQNMTLKELNSFATDFFKKNVMIKVILGS